MYYSEQHIIHDDRFVDLCVKAKNLYNQSLYYWRQSYFGKIERFTEYDLMKIFAEFNEETYRALPSDNAQQVIKFLFKSIKSWRNGLKEYQLSPSKFLGRPGLPKYKKETSVLYLKKKQMRVRKGYVLFAPCLRLKPIKTNLLDIDCARVVPKSNHFVIEFIYKKEPKPLQEYNGNWMGIDIGLNNLATCSTNSGNFIINGKPLKAINNFFNRKKGSLQSKLKHKIHTSNRIERVLFRRNQKVKDYIHKSSRKIVDIAKQKSITKIIIGKNENWKNKIDIGKKSNREFTAIPHATLIEKIQYKARLEGIEVILTQEAYTSKCSALDLEPIRKHEKYAGKRKKRGLFVTATGKLINADVNGSLNIARLVLGDEIINSDSIRSCVVQPNKVKNFM